jgi:hypothetical protein
MKVQQCHDVETIRAKWEQLVRAKWDMGTPYESNVGTNSERKVRCWNNLDNNWKKFDAKRQKTKAL